MGFGRFLTFLQATKLQVAIQKVQSLQMYSAFTKGYVDFISISSKQMTTSQAKWMHKKDSCTLHSISQFLPQTAAATHHVEKIALFFPSI